MIKLTQEEMIREAEAIRKLVLTYCDVIGTQNREDFRNLWTGNDNSLISITTCFSGLDSITEDFLIGRIQKSFTVIKLVPEQITVRVTDQEHGIVIFKYHTECIRRENGEPFGIAGFETQVVSKMDGNWKLNHIHYSM